jgi:Fe-S cluster biogenesis protein NfuA
MSGGFGGMLSLRIAGGEAAAVATSARVRVFKRATSLGGVESLIEHRASIEGPATPVPFDLLRLSIGLESPKDLIDDLEQALAGAAQATRGSAPGPAAHAPGSELDRAIQECVRPLVLARGGDVALASFEAGTVTLELSGSPGAALPLAGWAERLLARTVTGVDRVRLRAPTPAAADGGPDRLAASETDEAAITRALESEINPAVAAHGGRVRLVSATAKRVELGFEGRCQGCAMAEVTLRQGIEPVLRRALPTLETVLDVTDHPAGTRPFFSPGKVRPPD